MTLETIVPIGGFPVRMTTAAELAARVIADIPRHASLALFFANTNFVVRCGALRSAMRDPRVVIVNDGIGLTIAARLFHGIRFAENLNGTDFTPFLFGQAAAPLRVYLVGGRAAALAKAVLHVRERLGQDVVGSIDGYRDLHDGAVIDAIRAARPDVVLVALGNPLQEDWILGHRDAIGAGVLIGVGALFDFWAGDKPRAPRLVRQLHLEWLFRLALEPRRLLRRYTIDIVGFLWVCYRRRADGLRP